MLSRILEFFNHKSNNLFFTQYFASVSANSIIGLDMSHYQGLNIDWQKMVSAGVKFIIHKTTEGTNYKDDRFDTNYKNAKKYGLKVGAYHFLRPGNVDAQYQWFTRNLVGRVFEILPAIDVEVSGISQSFVDTFGKKLENFIAQNPSIFPFYSQTYPHPMIYTNVSLGNSIFTSASMSRYPLWLATRQTTNPTIPKTWKTKGLSVWQDAVVGGKQYGISGNVDHNYWGTFLPFPEDTPPTPVTKDFTIAVEFDSSKYSNTVKLEKK